MGAPRLKALDSVALRSMTADDEPAFNLFVTSVSVGERRFLKEDLEDPARAFQVFLHDRSRRVVAVNDAGDIVGLSGAYPGEGWSSHVAELRVLVADSHRSRGVGRLLAGAALGEALTLGCTHAYVEVVAEQEALVAMFQDMGFLPEALLPDFVRDGDGEFHDLMLLTHRASEHWARTHILDEGEAV